MTMREQRHQAIGAKARDIALIPFIAIANSKFLMAVVVILGLLLGISVWTKAAPVYDRLRFEATSWGYLPDGEYSGIWGGTPVSFSVDRAQTNDRACVVDVRAEDGTEVAPLYLFFSDGSLRLSTAPPSVMNRRGNVVERAETGEFSVTARNGRSPWLTFSLMQT